MPAETLGGRPPDGSEDRPFLAHMPSLLPIETRAQTPQPVETPVETPVQMPIEMTALILVEMTVETPAEMTPAEKDAGNAGKVR